MVTYVEVSSRYCDVIVAVDTETGTVVGFVDLSRNGACAMARTPEQARKDIAKMPAERQQVALAALKLEP